MKKLAVVALDENRKQVKVSSLFAMSSFDFAELLDADFIPTQICAMETMARTSRMNNVPEKGQQQITNSFQNTYATRQQESSMKASIKAQLMEFGFAEEVCDIAANSVQKITDKTLAVNVAIDTAGALLQARVTKIRAPKIRAHNNDTQEEDVKVGPVVSRQANANIELHETEADRMTRLCLGVSKPVVTPNKPKNSQLRWHISPSFLKSDHKIQSSQAEVSPKKESKTTSASTVFSFDDDTNYEMQLSILMDQVEKQQQDKQVKKPARASYEVTIKPKEPEEPHLKEPPKLVRLKEPPTNISQSSNSTTSNSNHAFFNYGESTLTQPEASSLLTQPEASEGGSQGSDSEDSDEQEEEFNDNSEKEVSNEKVEFDDLDDGLVDTDDSDTPKSREDLRKAFNKKKKQKIMSFFDTEAIEDRRSSPKTKTPSTTSRRNEEDTDKDASLHRRKKVIHIEDSESE